MGAGISESRRGCYRSVSLVLQHATLCSHVTSQLTATHRGSVNRRPGLVKKKSFYRCFDGPLAHQCAGPTGKTSREFPMAWGRVTNKKTAGADVTRSGQHEGQHWKNVIYLNRNMLHQLKPGLKWANYLCSVHEIRLWAYSNINTHTQSLKMIIKYFCQQYWRAHITAEFYMRHITNSHSSLNIFE